MFPFTETIARIWMTFTSIKPIITISRILVRHATVVPLLQMETVYSTNKLFASAKNDWTDSVHVSIIRRSLKVLTIRMRALDSRPKRKLLSHHCTVYSKIWAKKHTFGHANGTSQRAIWHRLDHRLSPRCRMIRRKTFGLDRRVWTLTIRITFWMTVTPHIRFSIRSCEKVILTIEFRCSVTRRSQMWAYVGARQFRSYNIYDHTTQAN